MIIVSFELVKNLLFIFAILTLFGCSESERDISFYHWKTGYNPSERALKYCDSLDVKKHYIRFFDVKWVKSRQRAFPFAILKNDFKDSIPAELVPVVYITNETFQKTGEHRIKYLAQDVTYKMRNVCQEANIPVSSIKEIQFDCDWSGTSRERYFEFLEVVREKIGNQGFTDSLKISSTIRLHQIKYAEKTGIPPVDKGVLMFYNMGKLSDTATANSILDITTAKKYMVNFKQYGIPLDAALPLFSWGVQFRNGKVVSLMNNLSSFQLTNNPNLEEIKPNYFRVKKASYLNDQFVYKGDEIRLEKVSIESLKEAIELLDEHIKQKDYELIYYHLDDAVISNYPTQEILDL